MHDDSTETYLDNLHAEAEELAERAKVAELMGDREAATRLRTRATSLVRKAARVRAQEED